MGIRAILQKGRTKDGMVLPADAQAKAQGAQDRSTVNKWIHGVDQVGNVQKEPASTKNLTNTTSPSEPPPKSPDGDPSAKTVEPPLYAKTEAPGEHAPEAKAPEADPKPDAKESKVEEKSAPKESKSEIKAKAKADAKADSEAKKKAKADAKSKS